MEELEIEMILHRVRLINNCKELWTAWLGLPEEAEESAAAAAQAEYPDEIGSMTAYYTGGPQQGRPPDGQLWPGTPVKVLQDAGSYSLILTADGIEAYVATAAIGPPGVHFK